MIPAGEILEAEMLSDKDRGRETKKGSRTRYDNVREQKRLEVIGF